MNPIIVDSLHRDRMLSVVDVTEIRDKSGELIGRFVPKHLPILHVAGDEFPPDEELDRRLADGTRYTAEEVMERLRSLRKSD